jgi:hypothetical protein
MFFIIWLQFQSFPPLHHHQYITWSFENLKRELLPERPRDFVRHLVNYIGYNPKRVKEYENFQEFTNISKHKLLSIRATRCLSFEAAVNRILEQWSSTLALFLGDQSSNSDTDRASWEKARLIYRFMNDP